MNLKSYKVISLLFFFSLVLVLGINVFKDRSHLKVYFLNVGQGDSIFVDAPNGNQLLIDGGPDKSVLRELGKVMSFFDRSIDVVMETHPDADHIGGLPEVFNRYDVGLFMEPGVDSKNSIDDEIERIRKEKGIQSILARRGMRINMGSGVVFDVLFPDKDVSNFETNTASIVGQLKYGNTSVMLTGDSPKKIEDYLVYLDGSFLRSDILKTGHHGSRTSSGEMFVSTVNPSVAVISAGKNNRYGHPNEEVVSLFEKLNINMFNTAKEGTIKFVSDGINFIKK
jgi:competence protein ComEC